MHRYHNGVDLAQALAVGVSCERRDFAVRYCGPRSRGAHHSSGPGLAPDIEGPAEVHGLAVGQIPDTRSRSIVSGPSTPALPKCTHHLRLLKSPLPEKIFLTSAV